jgi:hypothetical protein
VQVAVMAPQAPRSIVKHWASLPGWDVRAIAMRGDEMGGERFYSIVPGRDGWIYLRGVAGLYRLLDLNGRYERTIKANYCNGGFVDGSTWIPSAICLHRDGRITRVEVRRTQDFLVGPPLPSSANPLYRQLGLHGGVLTDAIPRAAGGWWFSYGYARELGALDSAGHSTLGHLAGVGVIRQVVALGDAVFVNDDSCRVALVRFLAVQDTDNLGCVNPYGYGVARLVRSKQNVYALASSSRTPGGVVMRYTSSGSRRSWAVPFVPTDLAQDRSGVTYVLGYEGNWQQGRYFVARLDVNGSVTVRRLPVYEASSIAIDARGRIWLVAPRNHSLIVLSPTAK